MIVTDRRDLRAWVVDHISARELDSVKCEHCGAQSGAGEVIDSITEAIINHTERPGWNADWSVFLSGLHDGGLLDLIRE